VARDTKAASIHPSIHLPYLSEVRPWGKPVLNVPNCSTPAAQGGAVGWGGCEALLNGTLDVLRRTTQLLNLRGKVRLLATPLPLSSPRTPLDPLTTPYSWPASCARACSPMSPGCNPMCCRCRSSPTQRPSCDRPDRRSGSTRRGQCHECVACVHHIVCHTLHHAAPHAAHHPDRRGSWQRCRGCSGPLTTRASEATPRSTPRPTTSPTCARRWHVGLQPLAGRAAASDTARAAASSR